MPQGGARGQNLGHLFSAFFGFYFSCMELFNLNRIFPSVTSDHRVQCPRVGLEVKFYDTPAGGIRASQGTFSSFKLYNFFNSWFTSVHTPSYIMMGVVCAI